MAKCPNCKRDYRPVLIGKDPMGYRRFQMGDLVQVAFPKAKASEREQLVTGLCSDECSYHYLGPEPDGDDDPGAVDRFGDPIPEARASFPNDSSTKS